MTHNSQTADLARIESKRDALRDEFLTRAPTQAPVTTAGVDHLALISSDLERTVRFYTRVVGMSLTKVIANRDEPTSTHIFLDMGGGNQLAFFDFPLHGATRTTRGVGSMHHVALKASADMYRTVLANLQTHHVEHSVHGDEEKGSVYFPDPDGILLEVTTGYD